MHDERTVGNLRRLDADRIDLGAPFAIPWLSEAYGDLERRLAFGWELARSSAVAPVLDRYGCRWGQRELRLALEHLAKLGALDGGAATELWRLQAKAGNYSQMWAARRPLVQQRARRVQATAA